MNDVLHEFRVSRVHFSAAGWLGIVDALCGKHKSRLPSFGCVPRPFSRRIAGCVCVTVFNP